MSSDARHLRFLVVDDNEDIRDDWEFTVVFLVVMDPKPKDPNAPADGDAAEPVAAARP